MKPTTSPKAMAERCRKLLKLYENAPVAKNLGIRLSFDDDFKAIVELPFLGRNCHGNGDVHGGVIATMIDNAGWFTAAVHYGYWIATTDLTMKLLEPAGKQKLTATAQLLRWGKRLAMTQMEVRNESGVLVAVGTGTFAATSVKYEPLVASEEG